MVPHYLIADGRQVAKAELLFCVADLLQGGVHLKVGEQREAGIHAERSEQCFVED